MWWKHVVEIIISFAILFSAVALLYGFIKMKSDERKDQAGD
jgi:hypothetical protein